MEESGAPQGHDGATAAHRASAEGASGPPDPPLEHILLGLLPPPGGRYRRPALDLLRRLLALIALSGGLSALVVAALHAHRRLSEPEHLRAVILAILIGTALAGAKLWVRRARLEGPWQTTGAGWIGALAVVAFLWPLGRLSDARDSFVATGLRPPIIWAMWLTVLGILLIVPYPWPRLAPRPGWARWVAVVVVAALTIPASAVLMGRALTLGSGLPTTAQTNVGQGWPTAERDGQGQWRIDAEDGIQTMVGTSAGALILERQDAETEDMHLTLIDPEGEPVWRRTIPPKAPDCVYQDEGLACGLTVDATGRRVAVLYGYEGDDLGGPPGGIGLAVLDTATGRLLWSRTLEDELVVSVALTAGHLALQTIRGDQLVGSTLSVYSLGGEDPYDGEPLWSRSESRSLLTASSTQLVLAPVDGGGIDPSFERADLVDALTGEAVGGIDEVEVRGGRGSFGHEVPPGWVARCTASCSRQDDSGRPGIELVSLDSGAVVDIGADGSRLGATTSGWLLSLRPPESGGGGAAVRYLIDGDSQPRDQPPEGGLRDADG
ncbi:PQQ-binding-like beta-propeller repeat protein [Actinomyces bowdenii]|uniref:outer membrane protein assembly factor BamB family protein n=1 Tax=Actinomyces bowdenii TaxID=131109 RepID=UPI00214AA1F2|nr:PQQ-binding-like beta-propeller repeat protein [Actinomyces bowdenii]MCR2053649.1 PQQ-binding-like beta-propeller repeat protein [Actinomyces bowdenii]